MAGRQLDETKRQPMAASAVALGARGAILPHALHWSLAEEKAEKWLRDLDDLVERGEWSSEEAGRWAGR